jgi:gliding motility-associated-like protein
LRHLLIYFLVFLNGRVLVSQSISLLPDTIKYCEGDSVSLNVQKNYDNFSNVIWRTPAGIITNTNKLNVKREGRYSVTVYSDYYSKQITDSVQLLKFSTPRVSVRDTFMCGSDPIQLNAGNESNFHLWSNGDKTARTWITKPGLYWVKVSNGVCSFTDSLKVKGIKSGKNLLPDEIGFCAGESQKIVSIKTEPGTKILWNTGANTPSISLNREGLYWVKTTLGPCPATGDTVRVFFKDCECQMLIPNSFTPNEDNRNDYFFPVSECEYTYFFISISDRWGNTIYTSNVPGAKWDGRFKGNLCPEDVYVYTIESIEKGSDKKQVRNGHVSLFR